MAGSIDYGNSRKERAAELFESGAPQAEVARLLGVSRVTAMQWYRLWKGTGREALLADRTRGPKPKLGPQDEQNIHRALHGSPETVGIPGKQWTLASVAVLIEKVAGVSYHRRHVGRLLKRMGWVIPPVGRHSAHAMRVCHVLDLDGNAIGLQQKTSARRDA